MRLNSTFLPRKNKCNSAGLASPPDKGPFSDMEKRIRPEDLGTPPFDERHLQIRKDENATISRCCVVANCVSDDPDLVKR